MKRTKTDKKVSKVEVKMRAGDEKIKYKDKDVKGKGKVGA